MLEEREIQSILDQHVPAETFSEDEAVRDYLVQLLQDEDAYEDLENLQETIQPFLNDSEQVASSIIEFLSEKMQSETSKTQISTTPTPKLATNEKPMRMGSLDTPAPSLVNETAADDSKDTEKSPSKSHAAKRKQRRERKPKASAEALPEDDASAWQQCQQEGQLWGGRGRGGRGEYSGAVNSIKSNIHLSNVNLSLPNGTELLQTATIDIVKGHRYGLIGRNGVGKSTLLQRLAQRAIPGMPYDMRVLLVQQQIEGSDQSALEVLVRADLDRAALLQEQEEGEQRIELEDISEEQLAEAAERLGDIAAELDAIDADTAEVRAMDILKGLQFTDEMVHGPTNNLSGGWRMRLALAKALFVPSDLILFDECTNHLDLYGLDWLISYLNQDRERTLIVVSHDRVFLDTICTDIVVMEHQKLKYHVGNYSEYDRQMQEKAARESQILDAAERQRAKAQAFIQQQQAAANKKSADPNKQRQARMMREKKLDRIGNYREDGKRYKLNSLKQLSEKHVRLAQKVVVEVDEPVIKLNFPDPSWPPGIAPNDPIVRMEDFSFSFDADTSLLTSITASVNRGSKIALVGRNGCGKSTLLKLIAGDLSSSESHSLGEPWLHPNLRIGHVTQYSVEELGTYAHQTVMEYAEEKLLSGKASASIVAKASGNIRQYLGAFGLGGKHALQLIGKLSGGERMRLCFATAMAEEPHLLLLDESTNHVDIETLDSMSDALKNFEGSVLMVSHNQGFLSGFCKELWVLEKGKLTINHSDTESFDEIFSKYRSSITGGKSLSSRRREKADMAKRATQQRSGARQNTALL